jgi:hypothetical protein
MTVQEVMERTGTTETKLVLAWIRDAIHLIQSTYNENIATWKTDINDGQRDYPIPADLIKIMSISVLDTELNKFKKIRRMIHQPATTEDLDPE